MIPMATTDEASWKAVVKYVFIGGVGVVVFAFTKNIGIGLRAATAASGMFTAWKMLE